MYIVHVRDLSPRVRSPVLLDAGTGMPQRMPMLFPHASSAQLVASSIHSMAVLASPSSMHGVQQAEMCTKYVAWLLALRAID